MPAASANKPAATPPETPPLAQPALQHSAVAPEADPPAACEDKADSAQPAVAAPAAHPIPPPKRDDHRPPAPQRHGSVSLSSLTRTKEETKVKNVALEPVSLTPDVLARLWKKLLGELPAGTPLYNLLLCRRVACVDDTNFNIIVADADFEELFTPHKAQVEQTLQSADYTNNPDIRCHVVTESAEERLIYEPETKFGRMKEKNPAMLALRQMFPDLNIG